MNSLWITEDDALRLVDVGLMFGVVWGIAFVLGLFVWFWTDRD